MLYGLLASFFNSMGDILYKKALQLSKKYISDSVYQLIGYAILSVFLVVSVVVIEGGFSKISLLIFGVLFINSALNVVCEYLEQYAFRNEKISILTPYGEFETIFATILGFIFFANNSLISFLCALTAGIVLIAGSVNFKKLKINKYCLALMSASFFTSLRYLIFGYVLISLTELSAVFYSILISFLIILGISLFKKEVLQVKNSPMKLNKYIFLEGIFWILSVLITMYLIKEEGIVEAVLFSMSYLAVNLILAYFTFHDIPKKKEVISICIVFGCMFVGYAFG